MLKGSLWATGLLTRVSSGSVFDGYQGAEDNDIKVKNYGRVDQMTLAKKEKQRLPAFLFFASPVADLHGAGGGW